MLLWFLADGGYGVNVVWLTVAVLVWLVYVVSGGLAMAWLWRTRQNAVLFEPTAPHTLPQAWVILGWLVPIVSYWFPVVVIRDIARASVRRPMGGLLGAWWAAYLVAGLGGSLGAQLAYIVPQSVSTCSWWPSSRSASHSCSGPASSTSTDDPGKYAVATPC